MKISYSWLKEYLPLDIDAGALAERLPQLGFGVDSVERRGPGFAGVVAAEVLAVDRHPNAERLSLCTVNDGAQKLSIVCGAKNVAAGQIVPLARVGAVLPGGRKITRAKIRGVESQGMICSGSELGLDAGPGDGILVMDPGTQVGSDVARALGPSDEILDVEVTPNRPDCLSHLGLARELSAFLRIPLKPRPSPGLRSAEGNCLPVEVKDPRACPRYMGRVFTGLAVGPSPGWLAARLESVGLRPINNLVDITNYLLMDIGQPLHAFDLDKLEGGRIVVRWARGGERLLALDDKQYPLTPECLVIADERKPAAVAGVMGGLESSVTDNTTQAFLESAHFAPAVVRRTSQLLRLRSDSSYRFERGTDIAAVGASSERAAELILRLCGGAKVSQPLNVGPSGPEPIRISTSVKRLNEALGSDFPEEAVAEALKGISAGFENKGSEIVFTPPSYRGDLATPWDLAEEVARMIGYDKIPSRAAPIPLRPSPLAAPQALIERCRARLSALGLFEAYNYDFISERLLRMARIEDKGLAHIANPLSEDWTTLRPTLLIGLLQNAAANLNRGAASVKLFEIGRVYSKTNKGVEERTHAAGLMLGPVAETFWKPSRTPRSDLYDIEGVVTDLLSGSLGVAYTSPLGGGASDSLFHPQGSRRINSPQGVLGAVGQIHPQVARAWELEKEGSTLFYLDLDLLLGLEPAKRRFEPYSQFPTSWRDLSIVLDQKHAYAEVAAAVSGCGIAELKKLELVDVFAGKGIPSGKKSLTLRLTFGRDDRTLQDAEVSAAVSEILKALKSRLGAVLRS